MKYLIVVAHPDDECLCAGASIWKWVKEGNSVDVCVMCSQAQARSRRPSDENLASDMKSSMSFLGIQNIFEGDFPNIKMNTCPHLELVQFIEKAILASQPDIVITHHPADVNDDHHQTSMACQAAIRLFQRRPDVKALREFWYMECLSATDWSLATEGKFDPNTFVEIGEDGIDAKINALQIYRDIMRPYPHPRSEECVKANATVRGAQSGTNYAEAFQCVLRRIV